MALEEYLFSHATYLPFFIEGAPHFDSNLLMFGIPSTGSLDLFIEGSYSAADSLMLFVGGRNPPCSSSLPLYCHNDNPSGSITLFIQGAGVSTDYMPVENTLMLYIKCAYGASLPLYMLGGPQPSANGSLDLYISGTISSTGSLDLVIPNVYGTISGIEDDNGNVLDLYTSGF